MITDNVEVSTFCSGEACEYTPATELIQGNYRFKVRARNAVGWGPISRWMAFSVTIPDGMADLKNRDNLFSPLEYYQFIVAPRLFTLNPIDY
ncbi:MAG: hypothetical protein ACXADH_18520 [Candidatus Kariarchaeaceae archaeon]